MTNTTSPLMIIDLQTNFLNRSVNKSMKNLLATTSKQIRLAKRRNAPIILVEYMNFGKTVPPLIRLMDEYPDLIKVVKDDDSVVDSLDVDTDEILNDATHLRVCGVNRDACVWASVIGILEKYRHLLIEVIVKGCANTWHVRGHGGADWKLSSRHPSLAGRVLFVQE